MDGAVSDRYLLSIRPPKVNTKIAKDGLCCRRVFKIVSLEDMAETIDTVQNGCRHGSATQVDLFIRRD